MTRHRKTVFKAELTFLLHLPGIDNIYNMGFKLRFAHYQSIQSINAVKYSYPLVYSNDVIEEWVLTCVHFSKEGSAFTHNFKRFPWYTYHPWLLWFYEVKWSEKEGLTTFIKIYIRQFLPYYHTYKEWDSQCSDTITTDGWSKWRKSVVLHSRACSCI